MVNEFIPLFSVMRNSFRYSLTALIHSFMCFVNMALIDIVHVYYQYHQGRFTAVVMSLALVNLKVIFLEEDTTQSQPLIMATCLVTVHMVNDN